jgi:hypothetical protein
MTLIEADKSGHGEEADHGVQKRRRVHPHGQRRDNRGAHTVLLTLG